MPPENENKKGKQRETASRPTVRIKPSHTEPSEIEGEAAFLRAAAAGGTERKPERKEDFEDVGPGFRVTPLLQAVLDLRQGRAEEEHARRRRRTEARNRASAAVAAGWLGERAERRRWQRAAQRAADLHGERMEAFRADRMARRQDEGYTMAVFEEEMEEVIAEVGGRGRLEGETDAGWYRRLREVEDEAWRVFNGNREVLTRGLGRYIDGLPAREGWRPWTCRPHFGGRPTGRRECLGCFSGGLRCSLTVGFGRLVEGDFGVGAGEGEEKGCSEGDETECWEEEEEEWWDAEKECSRCVRKGIECIQSRPEAGDDKMLDVDSWDVDGEGEVEDEDGSGKRRERRAEVEELLARKRGFVWGSSGWEERGGWALPRPEPGEWPWDRRR